MLVLLLALAVPPHSPSLLQLPAELIVLSPRWDISSGRGISSCFFHLLPAGDTEILCRLLLSHLLFCAPAPTPALEAVTLHQ